MRMIQIAAGCLATCFIIGCYSPYFKSTQGTLTNIGISMPNEEMLHFQIASYLGGDSIIVKDKAVIEYEWRTTETNNYFGLIKTENNRQGKIKVK